MKSNDLLPLLALGGLAYVLTKQKQGATPTETPFFEGVATPTGITPQMVQAAQASGMSNADIVKAAVQPQPSSVRIVSSSGKPRTISTPPPTATRTSMNGNQYLAPRSGGGYRVVGARNIVLNK